MYELKKNGKVFTSKFLGTGPSSYEKRIYRAAVSQRLRNTALRCDAVLHSPRRFEGSYRCPSAGSYIANGTALQPKGPKSIRLPCANLKLRCGPLLPCFRKVAMRLGTSRSAGKYLRIKLNGFRPA